jgi:uncharacterized protein YecT (DUF1311 family)
MIRTAKMAIGLVACLPFWGCTAEASLTENTAANTSKRAAIGDQKGLEENPRPDCKDGGLTTYDMVQCGATELRAAELEQKRYLELARSRFVDSVNSQYNEDGDADKREAVKIFDHAQEVWKTYRDEHCSSYHYDWKDGTVAGPFHVACLNDLTRERTWEIWKYWLHYADSTPPLLPEPKTGRQKNAVK